MMEDQLIPLSPNPAHLQSTSLSKDPSDPFSAGSPSSSTNGSDYSIIDYNLPNSFPPNVMTSTEKHLRSANNSPQKIQKKVKYEDEIRPRDIEDVDIFDTTSDKENAFMPADADTSGFSDATVRASSAGISRQAQEERSERSPSVHRSSQRMDQLSENSTPKSNSYQSSPSSAFTQKTITPHHKDAPTRLATLSQYSTSPESSPVRTPTNEKTTNLLLDFTQQFNNVKAHPYNPTTPSRNRRAQSSSPTKQMRDHLDGSTSPTKQHLSMATPNDRKFLLDFDIPPPPTPRSIPSVTPKELEALKSAFLAQIATLRAELSGKETEILSLKKSISETERRSANNTMELRQCREEIEDLSARSGVLESKLQEASRILSEARDEIEDRGRQIEHYKEDHDSAQKELDYTRKQLGEAQQQLVDSKRELASTKQDLIVEQQKKSTPVKSSTGNTVDVEAAVNKAVAAANAAKETDITAAVEKVAKELHGLYKSKHEQKVSALKSSYASRWEKRVKELEARNAELSSLNNNLTTELRHIEDAKDESLSGPIISSEDFENLKSDLARLEKEQKRSQEQIKKLNKEIEAERQEKGDLVLVVDEFMAMGGTSGFGSVNKMPTFSPMRNDSNGNGDWKSNSLRGDIEKMGGGASTSSSSGSSNRFGLGNR